MKISFDALALAPAVVPMVGALLVLLVDVVLPGRARLPWVLVCVLLTLAVAVAGVLAVVIAALLVYGLWETAVKASQMFAG